MSRSETAKRWQQRLRRFASSQMTVAQFCQSEGVSQPSFYQWKKKLRQPPTDAESKAAQSTVQFMPLRLSAESTNQIAPKSDEHAAPAVASTTIELPGGVRIHVEVPMNRQPGQHVEERS